ncbi:hypothetical protein [Neptuniibacter sp.]|uniref:hypothetical protein n=1 Tax=Neptuniibacter sp. TaxID=1962643 RepID=UPI00261E6D3E|nr:hypothetical protein [Neptuniibacter sp.]MCP4595772.1 hypothetical protein [Neptuniibacter sp.]
MLARRMLLSGGGGPSPYWIGKYGTAGITWSIDIDIAGGIEAVSYDGGTSCEVAVFQEGVLVDQTGMNTSLVSTNDRVGVNVNQGKLVVSRRLSSNVSHYVINPDYTEIMRIFSGDGAGYYNAHITSGGGMIGLTASPTSNAHALYYVTDIGSPSAAWIFNLGFANWLEPHTVIFEDDGTHLYVVGINSAANDYLTVMKIDPSSPSIVWQRKITVSSSDMTDVKPTIHIDASGNVIVGYYCNTDLCLSKWNSSGIHQWSKYFNYAAQGFAKSSVYNSAPWAITDSYAYCLWPHTSDKKKCLLFCFDISNAPTGIEWVKTLTNTEANADCTNAVAIDASDEVVRGAYYNTATAGSHYILFNLSAANDGEDDGAVNGVTVSSAASASINMGNLSMTESVDVTTFSDISGSASGLVDGTSGLSTNSNLVNDTWNATEILG